MKEVEKQKLGTRWNRSFVFDVIKLEASPFFIILLPLTQLRRVKSHQLKDERLPLLLIDVGPFYKTDVLNIKQTLADYLFGSTRLPLRYLAHDNCLWFSARNRYNCVFLVFPRS